MSDKYPDAYNFSYESEPNDSYISVDQFHNRTKDKLSELEERYWNCRDHLEHIELRTQIEQTSRLAESIYMMAQYSQGNNSIHLDDKSKRLIDYSLVGLDSDDTEARDAFERGMARGTDSILSTLAPDEEFEDVYFLRWHLDLLTAKWGDDVRVLDSGYADISIPTILPNIEVYYFYEPSSQLPQRNIYFRGEG